MPFIFIEPWKTIVIGYTPVACYLNEPTKIRFNRSRGRGCLESEKVKKVPVAETSDAPTDDTVCGHQPCHVRRLLPLPPPLHLSLPHHPIHLFQLDAATQIGSRANNSFQRWRPWPSTSSSPMLGETAWLVMCMIKWIKNYDKWILCL